MDKPTKTNPSGGRPRLSDQPNFLTRLNEVLPHLLDRTIGLREAARQLGCSPRSLKRYMNLDKGKPITRNWANDAIKIMREKEEATQLTLERLSTWNQTDWDTVLEDEDESVQELVHDWLDYR